MGERWTPKRAKKWLENLGIDEDSYGAVMEEHPSVPMATGHELKAAVTIASGNKARDIDEVYNEMREKFPEGRIR